MPGSKTSKKVVIKKCKYICKKGPNKGNKCSKNCKNNDYCKDHNPKRLNYKQKRNNKIKEDSYENRINDKINEIKQITNIYDLPDQTSMMLKLRNYQNEGVILVKRVNGIMIFLGKETEESLINKKYGLCNCDELCKNGEISQDQKYTLEGCVRCNNPPFTISLKRIFIEYNVRNSSKQNQNKEIENAKKLLEELLLRRDQLVVKIRYYKTYCDEVEKQKNILEKNNINEEVKKKKKILKRNDIDD